MLEIKINTEEKLIRASGTLARILADVSFAINEIARKLPEEAKPDFEVGLTAAMMDGMLFDEDKEEMEKVMSKAKSALSNMDSIKGLGELISAIPKDDLKRIMNMLKEGLEDDSE